MKFKEYFKTFNKVERTLTERDVLEGLAEEAAELSQAALKLIRAAGHSENKTPVKEIEAREALVEEFEDILMYIDILDIEFRDSVDNEKWLRWAERLDEHTV